MTNLTPGNAPIRSVRWAQVTFASFGVSSQSRIGGWQAGPSVDASQLDIDWIKQNADTDLAPLESISDYIGDEAVDALPRNFSYLPEESIADETVSVYMQSVPAGRDSVNRPGNVFTHAFIDTDPWTETTPVYPIDRFGSNDFARPYTIKMVDKVSLTRVEGGGPSPREGFVPTADEAIHFVCKSSERTGSLYRIQDALQTDVTAVVLLVRDRETAAIWLKAVSVTMSPLESQRLLRFSTFMRGNTIAGVGKSGPPALICVPTVDRSIISGRSDIAVISPEDRCAEPTTTWSKNTAEFLIREGSGPEQPMDVIIAQFSEHTVDLRQQRRRPQFGIGLQRLFNPHESTSETRAEFDSDISVPFATLGKTESVWETDDPSLGGSVGQNMLPESTSSSTDDAYEATVAATDPPILPDSVDSVPPSWEDPPEDRFFPKRSWESTETTETETPLPWEETIIGELRALGCTFDGWDLASMQRPGRRVVSPRPPDCQADRALDMLMAGLTGALTQSAHSVDRRSQYCIDAAVAMMDLGVTSGIVTADVLMDSVRNLMDENSRAIIAWCENNDNCPSLSPRTQRIIGSWWSRSVEKDTNRLKQLLGNAGSMTSDAKREGLGFINGDAFQVMEELGHRVLYSPRAAATEDVAKLYELVANKLGEVSQKCPQILPIEGALVNRWDEWYRSREDPQRLKTIIAATNTCGYSMLNFATAFGPHVSIGQLLTRLRAGFEFFLPRDPSCWLLSADRNALFALLRLDFTVVDFGVLSPLLSPDGTKDLALKNVVRGLLSEAMDWNALQQNAKTTLKDDIDEFYSTVLEGELKTATAHSSIRVEHIESLHRELVQYQASQSKNPSMYYCVRSQIIKLYLSSGSTDATVERLSI